MHKPRVAGYNIPITGGIVLLPELLKAINASVDDKLVVFVEDGTISIMKVRDFHEKYKEDYEFLIPESAEKPTEEQLNKALKLYILW